MADENLLQHEILHEKQEQNKDKSDEGKYNVLQDSLTEMDIKDLQNQVRKKTPIDLVQIEEFVTTLRELDFQTTTKDVRESRLKNEVELKKGDTNKNEVEEQEL